MSIAIQDCFSRLESSFSRRNMLVSMCLNTILVSRKIQLTIELYCGILSVSLRKLS